MSYSVANCKCLRLVARSIQVSMRCESACLANWSLSGFIQTSRSRQNLAQKDLGSSECTKECGCLYRPRGYRDNLPTHRLQICGSAITRSILVGVIVGFNVIDVTLI